MSLTDIVDDLGTSQNRQGLVVIPSVGDLVCDACDDVIKGKPYSVKGINYCNAACYFLAHYSENDDRFDHDMFP